MTDSAVFLFDSLGHSAHFVHYVTTKVMGHLKASINLTRVIIFTNGCRAQYKSTVPFHYLQNMATDMPVECCYFGSRHG